MLRGQGGSSNLIPGLHEFQPLQALCGHPGTPQVPKPDLPLPSLCWGRDHRAEGWWPWGLSQPCPRMLWEEGASATQGRTAPQAPTGMGKMPRKPFGEAGWRPILGHSWGHVGADRSLRRRDTGPSLGMHGPSSLLNSDVQGLD